LQRWPAALNWDQPAAQASPAAAREPRAAALASSSQKFRRLILSLYSEGRCCNGKGPQCLNWLDLTPNLRACERPESAHPTRCRSLERRSVDRTDSGHSVLSVETGQIAPFRPSVTVNADGSGGWECDTPDSPSLRCPCFKTDLHTSAARIAARVGYSSGNPALRKAAAYRSRSLSRAYATWP
jgi:hypothetical protein